MRRHSKYARRAAPDPLIKAVAGARLSGAMVLIVSVVVALPAHALDLNGPSGVQTHTSALREWLRNGSDHKIYGAETIRDRDRRPYRADGIRAGNFIFLPELGAAAVYDDNIFASDTDEIEDLRSEIAPSLRVRSALPRHALDIGAGARLVNYARHSERDFVDGFGHITGALHFDHAHTLALTLSSRFEHKDHDEIFAPAAAAEAIPIWHSQASLALTRDAGRLYGTVSAGALNADYFDVKAFDGSTVDQDARDYALIFGQLNWGYRFSPGYELVGKTRVLRRLTRGNEQIDWDAFGYEALLGVNFELNPLLRFHLLGGLGIRDYDRAEFDTTSTGLIEAGVQWLATQQMTVSATLRRNFGDATSPNGADRIETEASADMQYELWRNLLFSAGASAREYSGDTHGRLETIYTGKAALEYLHTKNWAFNMSAEHRSKVSQFKQSTVTRNKVRVGAKLSF